MDKSPKLIRHMGVWQLTAFGLNYMIPIAPAIIFGLILKASGGTVAVPYAIACIAMLFTGNSYMLMVQLYPVSGSLYTYIANTVNPHIGFIAGWVILLDYIFIPTATSISAVYFLLHLINSSNFKLWYILFTIGIGLINLLGIKLIAGLGLLFLIIGEAVILSGFVIWGYAVHNGVGVGHLISNQPFHFETISSLSSATAISILSYLGFDAISTLSEEAVNPQRDIPKAILLSILLGGLTMFLTGYIGMLVIPNWNNFINDNTWANTTLFYVSQLTGGNAFAIFYTIGFILAMVIFNIVATTSCSRLLYGMGSDGVLPKFIFAKLNNRFHTPHYNILLIIILQLLFGLIFSIDKVAELINFGAVIGFIMLNFTVIVAYFNKQQSNWLRAIIFPVIGNLVMLWILSGMAKLTFQVGCSWLILGIIIGYIKSKGYKQSLH